jgi:chemotaxis protein MotB
LESQKQTIEKEQQLSASARSEVALLSDQISRLREQLEVIKTALARAKAAEEEKDEKIPYIEVILN